MVKYRGGGHAGHGSFRFETEFVSGLRFAGEPDFFAVFADQQHRADLALGEFFQFQFQTVVPSLVLGELRAGKMSRGLAQ